ncbi:MAG: hypothetical protein O2931_09435 [Planctomycetota bacterium]|nr:hypothetical protein [Planctomycetota bacterium]MDA1179004.1 hypothetical protein [Planctomycetota bacterium]
MNSRLCQPTETFPSDRLPRSSVKTAFVVRGLLQLFIMPFIAIGATIYITPAAVAQNSQASTVNDTVPFSARVEALPYPPDAREIELDATFHGIEFRSGSSLASLDAFYRRELRQRGWIEDESAAKRDEESSDMTFTQDNARLDIELDVYSKEIAVNIDCEELDFGRSTDPAALAAAGVPQPRSYLFLQKEIARPSEIQERSKRPNTRATHVISSPNFRCKQRLNSTVSPCRDWGGASRAANRSLPMTDATQSLKRVRLQ